MNKTEIESATPAELNRLIHLHVLGDDLTANTDERIEAAVGEVEFEDSGMPLRVVAMRCHLLEYWQNREGKPYQSDLEAHVAA